jgi:hypothetical protein
MDHLVRARGVIGSILGNDALEVPAIARCRAHVLFEAPQDVLTMGRPGLPRLVQHHAARRSLDLSRRARVPMLLRTRLRLHRDPNARARRLREALQRREARLGAAALQACDGRLAGAHALGDLGLRVRSPHEDHVLVPEDVGRGPRAAKGTDVVVGLGEELARVAEPTLQTLFRGCKRPTAWRFAKVLGESLRPSGRGFEDAMRESCAFRGFRDRREQVAQIVQTPPLPASSGHRVSELLGAARMRLC